ncbi:8-oxo-dGTP pyrophosphatase MutT (NUDIX family) [Amycolatopsis magusensis]|uniref:8-oxo-dGTP pyrophosphatase MutT (NUDIX family) n=2 Tax=Amycolatopsis magusensis TaxID=882444 RepID=A0ABS4PGH0_9PSEU|nr:8-oxo-dGTP pyrophosphatase MutT (NUDIX family) [Amycolatopsis magusensis]
MIERISSREVYRNNWMSVREDDIRRPDGSTGIYGVVDKPEFALVIPLDGDRLHLVGQFRYPLGERTWEFVQGTAPDLADLDPAELAVRELREETGLEAGSMVELGRLSLAPGLTSQRGRVYLATDLREGPPQRELEEQDMRTGWFPREEFEKLIISGEITDAPTIAAYGLLRLHGH